jgi:hypothetical protein
MITANGHRIYILAPDYLKSSFLSENMRWFSAIDGCSFLIDRTDRHFLFVRSFLSEKGTKLEFQDTILGQRNYTSILFKSGLRFELPALENLL